MPDSSSSTAPSSTTEETDFGANDWLLEEMYEQYTADPSSVDQTWATYFAAARRPGCRARAQPSDRHAGRAGPGRAATAAPPAPRRRLAGPEAPAGGRTAAAAASRPAEQAATPSAGTGRAASRGHGHHARGPTPTVEKPSTNREGRPATPGQPRRRAGRPAEPVRPPRRRQARSRSARTLRGAPARTAKNMDLSLSVPTATSVRSLPVKLLIDQRVVINNHLRRARGGKVSYTHLIGYAMVQALKSRARP